MGSFNVLLAYRPFLPWICSSLALGYAAYLHWRLRRLKDESKKLVINPDPDTFTRRDEVNIDNIDRNAYRKKRVSYCRCWKSSTWPLCDGVHKQHNRENNDCIGPLVLVWNEPETEPEQKSLESSSLDASIIEHDNDMDIKSIDSESPILQSSNGNNSNGEFERMEQMGGDAHISSDEQLSSIEMVEESFDAQRGEKDDDDEDTVKVEP